MWLPFSKTTTVGTTNSELSVKKDHYFLKEQKDEKFKKKDTLE
jgi:hypothetical protein